MFQTLKKLIAQIPRKRRYFFGLLIITGVAASQAIFIAFGLKYFTLAAQSHELSWLYLSLVFMGAGFFILLVLLPIGYWLYESAAVGGSANLREAVYKSLLRIKTKWLDIHHSGDLTSRATTDILEAEKAYRDSFINMVELVTEGFGSSLAMFIIDWKLASALSLPVL